MKLHRLAMLHLDPVPAGWEKWVSTSVGTTENGVELRRLRPRFTGGPPKSTKASAGWLVSGVLNVIGLPDLDNDRRIVIPLEWREPCEDAIEVVANLISVLGRCSRTILSPIPCIALEYESHQERRFLEDSGGIAVEDRLSEMAVRAPISRTDPRLIAALSDRPSGLTLLAEAYSAGGESSQYRDYVRFFELAFMLPCSKLAKKLTQFLSPSMGYTRSEIQGWMDLRDALSHGDLRKAEFIALASDIRTFLMRMEQACLDVLFNKADWMKSSSTRRNVWTPDALSTSAQGNLVARQGSRGLSLVFRSLDEFGVYPRDLGAVLGSFEKDSLYATIAGQSTKNS